MIVLTPIKKFMLPICAEAITIESFQGKTVEEISKLPANEGNKERILGNLFKIEEAPGETPNITLNGDFSKVKRIGQGMKNGEIIFSGDAGMHTGEKMSGGKITINGNASGWTASQMKGGIIEIHGNASDYLASPYRGSDSGMKGGQIFVDGNIGSDSGCYMKGGVIKIKGNAGRFLGFHMTDGAIYVGKDCGSRAGANMHGGKIVIMGAAEELLPTFQVDSIKPKVKIDDTLSAPGPFYVFLGDLAENGRGKIFASKNANPALKSYEKYF
jgi:formylmethanofuran dehydrogenase subunit C